MTWGRTLRWLGVNLTTGAVIGTVGAVVTRTRILPSASSIGLGLGVFAAAVGAFAPKPLPPPAPRGLFEDTLNGIAGTLLVSLPAHWLLRLAGLSTPVPFLTLLFNIAIGGTLVNIGMKKFNPPLGKRLMDFMEGEKKSSQPSPGLRPLEQISFRR